ncbi:MAG: phage tail tape measure protein [Evtepia sp.]
MADFGVKVSANVEVDREGFISQLQALAKGITVKVGVEVDEASKASFLNSLRNIVPKTPVKVRVEPEMAGKNSIAQKVSSMAGKISIGKGMQVSKAGMTSMAKQVQSELNRAKLNLKLNKIDADAPITEVGKQLKEEVSDISAGKDVKIDGDTGGLDRTLEETAEMSSRVAEGLSEAQNATASWKDQVKDLDRIMKNVSSSTDNALRSKTNSLTNADNVAKVNEEYQKLSDSIRKIRDAGTPVNNSEIVHLEKQVAAYDEMIAKMREAEAVAKSSSAASAQSAAKELAAQQKILDTLEKRANTLYDSALTGKKPAISGEDNVAKVQQEYQSLIDKIHETQSAMNSGGLVDESAVANIEKQTAAYNKMIIAMQKAESEAKQVGSASSSSTDSAVKTLEAQLRALDKLQSQLDKKYNDALVGKNRITDAGRLDELTKGYQKVSDHIIALKNKADSLDFAKIKEATDQVREFDDAIEKLRTGTNNMGKETVAAFESQLPLMKRVETFYQQMERFMRSNTKAAGTSQGKAIRSMMDQIVNLGVDNITEIQLADMRKNFTRYQNELMRADKLGKTFSDRVIDAYQRFGGWSIITNSLGHAVMAVRDMITNVVNLDTAMTELKKVTDETDATYEHFFTGAADRAREIGATVTDTITATADFARLGYDIDQASALADAALVYKNVGDGIENISDASDSIISTMMAFEDLEGRDPMRIVDAFNELGNNFAISSEGLGEALTRSASGLAAANNTFEESAALVTAMNSTVQDPQKVGTTLKTVSMYLRAAKVEAQEAGIETEGMANSVSKLREDVMALTNGKVDIMIDDSTFKSTYQIMDEISQAWDEMTDVDQAALLEMIGGKRNSDAVMSLIKNFDVAREAYQDALGSEGSALKENEKYLDSIQGRVQQFKASFEELSAAFIDSDFAKGVVSFGTTFLDGLTAIIEKLGSIPSLLATISGAISAIRGIKGDDQGSILTPFTLSGEDGAQQLGVFGKSFQQISETFKAAREGGAGVAEAVRMSVGAFSDAGGAIDKYNSILKSGGDGMDDFMNSTKESNRALYDYLNTLNGGEATMSGFTSYVKKSGDGIQQMGIKAKAAAVGMNALKVAMNTMLIGLVTFAISSLISKIAELAQASEKAREEAASSAQELNESNEQMTSYKSRIEELRTALNSGTLTQAETVQKRQELLSIQEEIVSEYGREAEGINLVTDNYDVLIEKLNALQEARWRAWEAENTESGAIQDVVDKFTNVDPDDFGVDNTLGTDRYNIPLPSKVDILDGIRGMNLSDVPKTFYEELQSEFDKAGVDVNALNALEDGIAQAELNPENAYALLDTYQKIYDIVGEVGNRWFGVNTETYLGGTMNDLQGQISAISNSIAQDEETFNTHVEGVLNTNEAYQEVWGSALDAQQKYNEALASGDEEGMRAAIQNMNKAKADFENAGWDDAAVNTYMENFFSEFESETHDVSMKLNVKADIENDADLKDSVLGEIEKIQGEEGIIDIAKLDEIKAQIDAKTANGAVNDLTAQEQAYVNLNSTATEYGMTVAELVSLMGELGYVTVNGGETGSETYSDMTQQTQDVISGIQNAQKIIASQAPGQSISIADFNAEGMEDYRSALEYVNGAMQLNADKVKEITEAKAQEQIEINNTNKALAQEQYLENARQIQEYRKELEGIEDANSDAAKGIQSNIDSLLSQNEGLVATCQNYDLLSASLREATGAYQNWLNAQSGSDYGDMADNTLGAIERIRDTFYDTDSEFYGDFGTKKFAAAVDLIIPESVDADTEAEIEAYMTDFKKYLTFDEEGNVDGLNVGEFMKQSVDAGLASYSEEDGWVIAGQKSMEDFVKGLGLSEGVVQAFFDEMESNQYGTQFDWSDESIKSYGDLMVEATEAAEKLRGTELGEGLKLKIDVSDIESTEEQLSTLDGTIAEMNSLKAKLSVDSSEYKQANSVIQYCVAQKQLISQPDIMRVDTSQVEGDLGNALSLLQQFQQAQWTLEQQQAIGVDTTAAQANVDALVEKIQGLDNDTLISLGIDPTSISAESIQAQISSITPDMLVNLRVNPAAISGYNPETKHADVIYNPKTDLLPEGFDPVYRDVIYEDDLSGLTNYLTPLTRNVYFNEVGKPEMNGTAHAGGTARVRRPAMARGSSRAGGEAKLNGDWGTARGGRTLVGELGREIVVNPVTGLWYTVGDIGPEFVDIPKGAIVFNHIQTEQLLKNGYADGRATALASGTAMVTGGYKPYDPVYGGGGSNSNKGSSSSNKKPSNTTSNHTVKVTADATDLEEQLKDTLDKIKEEIDDIIGNLEHEIFLLEKNHGDPDEIVSIYREMQDQVHDYAEKYRAQGLDENSDYIQDLQKQWWEYQESIQEVIVDTYEKATQEQENAITLTENWLDNAFADRDFKNVQIYVDDIVGYYEKMQQIIHEQAEYYRSQGYSDTSDEVSELSDLWWDYEENIKEVKQQVVDHLIEMVDTASEAVDNIQDVMDTFKDAADEYAKNGGFISVDAFQEIVKLGPQYMQYLEDENGLLQINEESINRVIAAKTEQLALESAMNYIERLRLALQAESIEDLNNLLYATTETTNATWGLVYANLALLDLTGPQYEAALHNINAIRALAQNAISGIGKVTGEAEENLQDMKDGLDDILQYVMDMLEDRVQRQIDALEEMKDSYAELIELKKESMEATKEETDYQDEVADKVKEIADLQARINALSLDDSRDAQAQRIELEEQMAELQRELSDTQADYAIDRQEESLDKMQDAYEEQKDQEIEKLEQTISSQEKLYQMA